MNRLRTAAIIAVAASAAGSFGLMLRAGRRSPALLIVIFTVWVLFPFAALLWAGVISKRWPVLTQATLYVVMLIAAVGSLAIYADDAVRPRKAQTAFVYVAVPPASCVLAAIVVPIAALISAKRSRGSAAARSS